MHHNDSNENSQELENQSNELLYEIQFYIVAIQQGPNLEELKLLENAVKTAANAEDKAVLSSKYQKILDNYLSKLALAEHVYEMLAEEKKEEIFSINPALSQVKKLLLEVIESGKEFGHLYKVSGENRIQKNISLLEGQPRDILRKILPSLDRHSLANLRMSSKKLKEAVDELFFAPSVVIKVANEFTPIDVIDFIDAYMQSKQYAELREQFTKDPKKLSPLQFLCIALTTPNIYELNSDHFLNALESFNNLQWQLRDNLLFMLSIKEVSEITDAERKKIVLEEFKKSFDSRSGADHYYMNLKGAEIPEVRLLGGVNFGGNTKFSPQFKEKISKISDGSPFFLVSRAALISPKMMEKQLNQLQKMIKSLNDPEVMKNMRLIVLMNCYNYLESSTFGGKEPNRKRENISKNKEHLEAINEMIDVVLNHSFTKDKAIENNLKDSLLSFWYVDSNNIHDKLKQLKKEILVELHKIEKIENTNPSKNR